ncbi:MAG: glutamate--tRNA ligase family protein [Proteobacteria bacterium]|jgi:glutamyl/glutaminyl-tRNA synthetase|nr:glutamate--tRNA ligase family protein [Pseudomonadota bacterium]
MKTTRFNPTANGRLHLGHLYLILVNYHTAKSTGGKFIVRFDDDQSYWIKNIGIEKIEEYCQLIKEDLEWMGIVPDLYSYESKEKKENESYLRGMRGIDPDIGDGNPDSAHFAHYEHLHIKSIDRPYPYVPYLTAIKVVQDCREGCNTIIRGEDLLSEYSLYCHFCTLLDIPIPALYFLPKLMQQKNNVITDLSDVSKTAGNFKIADCRNDGYTPQDIVEMLAKSCLINMEDGWKYDNIKQRPTIG